VHCIRESWLQSLAISAVITQADNLRVHAPTSASLSRSTLRKTRKLVALNYAAAQMHFIILSTLQPNLVSAALLIFMPSYAHCSMQQLLCNAIAEFYDRVECHYFICA